MLICFPSYFVTGIASAPEYFQNRMEMEVTDGLEGVAYHMDDVLVQAGLKKSMIAFYMLCCRESSMLESH